MCGRRPLRHTIRPFEFKPNKVCRISRDCNGTTNFNRNRRLTDRPRRFRRRRRRSSRLPQRSRQLCPWRPWRLRRRGLRGRRRHDSHDSQLKTQVTTLSRQEVLPPGLSNNRQSIKIPILREIRFAIRRQTPSRWQRKHTNVALEYFCGARVPLFLH